MQQGPPWELTGVTVTLPFALFARAPAPALPAAWRGLAECDVCQHRSIVTPTTAPPVFEVRPISRRLGMQFFLKKNPLLRPPRAMPHVVISCAYGTAGDTLPPLALAEALLRRGSAVTIITDAYFAVRLVLPGASVHALGSADDTTVRNGGGTIWRRVGQAFARVKRCAASLCSACVSLLVPQNSRCWRMRSGGATR